MVRHLAVAMNKIIAMLLLLLQQTLYIHNYIKDTQISMAIENISTQMPLGHMY